MHERIVAEGREFSERRWVTQQDDRVRRDAAKRQKCADIDAKLTALLGDAEWLPQVHTHDSTCSRSTPL